MSTRTRLQYMSTRKFLCLLTTSIWDTTFLYSLTTSILTTSIAFFTRLQRVLAYTRLQRVYETRPRLGADLVLPSNFNHSLLRVGKISRVPCSGRAGIAIQATTERIRYPRTPHLPWSAPCVPVPVYIAPPPSPHQPSSTDNVSYRW